MHNTLNNERDNSLTSNAFGFMRIPLCFNPYEKNDNQYVITGAPFDLATSGRSGSRFGPNSIRQMSTNLTWEENRWPWNFNFRQYVQVIDCGDLVYSPGNAQEFSDKLYLHAKKLLSLKKYMITIGGDHFITLPILRAYKKYFGKIALIQFDAHSDTYPSQNIFDHGSTFYHAINEDLIDPLYSVQIGIRTQYNKNFYFKVFDSIQVNNLPTYNILKEIKSTIGDMFVYISIDIDCLDPAYAPGTGTPVIGGISTEKIGKIIRGLTDINIIGMDVVEVSPPYDASGITSLAAATIILDLIYLNTFRKK
ncbi:agmatinase [Candidatus Tachikawaea gelatinosa]|uniref:Agmatinase n=1 Tax=Candidatus Tachikawaea gelatinosa TaxID=1410383 RepID=A0A090ALZ6_9ENTR|nr:agmatinase [Candidatus Tachikawaea gelatinosa]BAP58679.1 agmatinase [Candidatus Tachikawaea gelatinosa]